MNAIQQKLTEAEVRTAGEPVEPEQDAEQAAKAARLRYVSDARPGIRRVEKEGKFHYLKPDGSPVTEERTLQRIRSLAIPPAYSDVWICTLPHGHLQATGRDSRGRKQYRYHPRWREVRDSSKFDRMLAFGEALPVLRQHLDADLRKRALSREKVLAAVTRLLDTTFIRIGNEEYARTNESYGLTTLHNEHVDVEGNRIRFHFRGKSGKEHDIELRDTRIARVVRRCQELPGQELFAYIDEQGEWRDIGSGDVNEYLKAVTGQEFTAKDFRTFAGTVLCTVCLRAGCENPEQDLTQTEAKKRVTEAVKAVAARLGNTPAVCRKSYIHPRVIEAYLEGELDPALEEASRTPPEPGLSPDEAATLAFLRQLA